uniref:Uncharacterized protein n=1 Tax=Rhizophora mucronata TaxID=61149 RepID=A0A2P2JGI4_RHIMU
MDIEFGPLAWSYHLITTTLQDLCYWQLRKKRIDPKRDYY